MCTVLSHYCNTQPQTSTYFLFPYDEYEDKLIRVLEKRWINCNTTKLSDSLFFVAQLVTEQLKVTFVELRDAVSPELNYSKYKEEICSVNMAPCIPKLCKHHNIQQVNSRTDLKQTMNTNVFPGNLCYKCIEFSFYNL